MSFRDLRNLTEMMRALGYPRLISMENFRQPNFQLVSEMVCWLVKRFDPNADLPRDIDTEQDRVMLVRSVVQFMASKAHIKLHAKKLYQSDGYAVKEVIKMASVLYNAMKMNQNHGGDPSSQEAEDEMGLPTFDISFKLSELKLSRQLGSQITEKGATLYDLLGKEVDMREKRNLVLAKQLEISQVELALKNALRSVENEIKKTSTNMENVAANEANLEAKIEKKKTELERNQKRLLTLQKVRPAFMDEFEALEEELKKLYEVYIVKFRCLAYLEQQVEDFERMEQERMEERKLATTQIMERIKKEPSIHKAPFHGSAEEMVSDLDSDEDDDDDDDDDDDGGGHKTTASNAGPGPHEAGRKAHLQGKSRLVKGRTRPMIGRRVFGSMTGNPGDGDADSCSLDSDSDLLLDGDGGATNSEDDEDEDEEDEERLEVNELAAESLKSRKSAKGSKSTQLTNVGHNSDDDF